MSEITDVLNEAIGRLSCGHFTSAACTEACSPPAPGEAPAPQRYYLMARDRTRIWEDIAWWRPARCGYTDDLNEAGIYSEAEARLLCRGADDPVAVPVELADMMARTQRRVSKTGKSITDLMAGAAAWSKHGRR